jgi:hypothetical protein
VLGIPVWQCAKTPSRKPTMTTIMCEKFCRALENTYVLPIAFGKGVVRGHNDAIFGDIGQHKGHIHLALPTSPLDRISNPHGQRLQIILNGLCQVLTDLLLQTESFHEGNLDLRYANNSVCWHENCEPEYLAGRFSTALSLQHASVWKSCSRYILHDAEVRLGRNL